MIRKFHYPEYPEEQWWYGEGTRYPEGDFVINGELEDAAGPSLSSVLSRVKNGTMKEIMPLDPDLVTMEGL